MGPVRTEINRLIRHAEGVRCNIDQMPHRKTPIVPPIIVSETNGEVFTLSTVEHVIEYVRRRDNGAANWARLRDGAFVAAAVPSAENIEALRVLAGNAFELARADVPASRERRCYAGADRDVELQTFMSSRSPPRPLGNAID